MFLICGGDGEQRFRRISAAKRFARMIARRQRQLDRHFGGGAWGMMRLASSDLAATIRSFFGEKP